MRTTVTLLASTLCVVFFGLSSVRAGEAERQGVAEMKSALRTGDLNRFVQAIGEKKWKAPIINSAWHVENRVLKDKRAEEIEKRTVGKSLVDSISNVAQQLAADTEASSLEQGSEALLVLGGWLEGAEGYGNLLLAARARDVATVGIGKLLIRPDYPFEKAANLVAKLNRPPAAVRAKVLNREAGATLFPSTLQPSLEEVWRSGALLRREQQNHGINAASLGNPAKEAAELAKAMQQAKQSVIDTPAMLGNLAFFADDDAETINEPPTLANTWERKRHEEIVYGLESQNVVRLRALVKFRATVGSFPTEPVKHPFYKGREAAFDKAWRPHATKEEQNLGGLAWRTYEAIQKGEFWDADTRMVRLETAGKTRSPR